MEAVIVALFALAVVVVLEASYWIALGLTRWAPVLAAGVFAAWVASRIGLEPMDAMPAGGLASLIARHFTRPRKNFRCDNRE